MASSQEALLPAATAAGDDVVENALSPFVFEPLLAGPCTRLLTLDPGTGHGPLTGSMSVHPLRGRRRMPSYHALSYCWGEESERTQEILINGMTYMITANAHNALAHSRSPKAHGTLWIDQISINQEDLDEKSRHIGYMGAIYREADVVVAYLGEETEGVDVLFAFMNALEYEYRNSHIWWKKWRMRRAPADWFLADVFRPGKKLFPSTEARLRTFAQEDAVLFHNARMELLARPWFRRMWIVQEAGLARRLLVRVGPHTAGWEGLMDVVHELIYAWPGARTMDVVTGFKSAMAINMLIREIKQPLSWADTWRRVRQVLLTACRDPFQLSSALNEARTRYRYIPTLPLLRQFRHQLASSASDKIFALAGLAPPDDSDRFLRHAGYGRTVAQNCFYFALAHVVQTGTLDVLAATCLGARAHEVLPSWCPDWSQGTPFCDTGYALSSYGAPPHGAGMRYGVTVDLLEGTGWAVVVLGVEFDVVASVVEVSMTIDEFDKPLDPVWAAWNEFAMGEDVLSGPYISAEDRWDTYWRTLAYNSSGGGGGRFADASLGDVFRSFLDGALADRKRWTGRLVFKGRRLYRTRRGYLGNGCDQVRAGDKVYVCHGARFPLVLREDGEEVRGARAGLQGGERGAEPETWVGHRMVGGDTYIHGLCQGEGLDIAEEEGLEPRMVCLT